MTIATHDSNYQTVACDVCGATESRYRYTLIATNIVSCTRCGLSFVNPRVKSEVLLARLQSWAEQDTVDEDRLRIAFETTTLALYRRYLNWIRRYVPRSSSPSLLDVGCSVGAFIKVAAQAHWQAQGLELGRASSQYARQRTGLTVAEGSIYQHDYTHGSLDVVTMLEVIEHLESPRTAVLKVSEWLKPSGLLFITTPNFDSLYRRIHGEKWWVINCEDEHIIFFNLGTLRHLLESAGFELVFWHNRGFDLVGLLKQLKRTDKTAQGRTDAKNIHASDYYSARERKEAIKHKLDKLGLLRLSRAGLRILDEAASVPWSPLSGLAEQLIVIGRKKS